MSLPFARLQAAGNVYLAVDGLCVETGAGLRWVWPRTGKDGRMAGARIAMGQPVFRSEALPLAPEARGAPLTSLLDVPLTVGDHVLAPDRLRARIFERGEGETLSSGTGSTACAVAARARGLCGDAVRVELRGGVLEVEWDGQGEAWLEGPAVETFEGLWPA